jgi:hypothetical protein
MYSIGIFLFIAVIDVLFTNYALSEKGADYYKDLIALGIATFLTVYLALAASSGTVMLTATTYLMDAGLMWIGFIIATAQGFILLLEVIETVQDYYAQKMQRLIS